MEGNYSLSDIAAASGEGFGGGSAWILIILFALIFGWGGNGFGNNRTSDYGQFATAASQQEILFGQQFQNLNSAINKIGDGISSLGYSQLQQMDNNTASINGNITTEGRALQTQMAECCCNIKEAIHSEAEATRAVIAQNKIEALQQKISQLELQSAMSGVVRYPNALTYNAGGSPFCNYSNCNCGNI